MLGFLSVNDKSSITSEPFYTSTYGYKLCVRLSLNGDDIDGQPYLSVSFILMRGTYDAILDWPFDFQVIFCLYDTGDQKNHIIESIRSDKRLINFQRPRGYMNIEYIIPKFIPLWVIQQENSPYVADDSIFVKVIVRKKPIPNYLLPNVLNINMAWPVHIQEEIIEKLFEIHELQSLKIILKLKLLPC